MLLKVLENYKSPSNFENPIELLKGDTVQLGEITDPNGEYPDWVFCTADRTKRTGWVAAGVLRMENGVGTVLQDYTSKEMAVSKDDTVTALYELNGWYWCNRPSDGETGWIAKNNLTVAW